LLVGALQLADLGVQPAEHLLAGFEISADVLLAGLQRFLKYITHAILSGLEGFELLMQKAYVGGLAGDVPPAGKCGADEPDQKAQNEQKQNADYREYQPLHSFTLEQLL
jgi:hypothetical protein